MGGDYSRFTFDPKKNYSAVLRQQGRVGLDSDANEAAAIGDRRWRAETMDVIGRSAVSRFTTPDAFKITPMAASSTGPDGNVSQSIDLGIGFGRMYVDGLLAENHGRELQDPEFDASLDEARKSSDVTYNHQPYYPSPPPLTGSSGENNHLVYLDVWQREVTALEDPDIREVALGGPDTATRVQTVWQVKVLENVRMSKCKADLEAWRKTTAPSAGRLTTSTVAPDPSKDPCIISPEGGYRGVENRLYRVEIHTGGSRTAARFKWSRDNASVVSAVTGIAVQAAPARTRLTVESLGRDRTLSFQTGDWVEVVDDHGELAGKAGFMAKVTGVEEADRVVVLDGALPATDFDLKQPSQRHTRLRRWDASGKVYDGMKNLLVDLDAPGAEGLIPLPAAGTSVRLEDGIEVELDLSPSNGEFKVGDYWVFAARTATGEVDKLKKAPPRGIHHHYCKLALVNGSMSQVIEDCRTHWPPQTGKVKAGGLCTVILGVDAFDLVEAVAKLPQGGGCICIPAGDWEPGATVHIDGRRRITIEGCGPASRIRCPGHVVFSVDGSNDVVFRNFAVSCEGDATAFRLAESNANGNVVIEGCTIEIADGYGVDAPKPSKGSSGAIRIHGNRFESTLRPSDDASISLSIAVPLISIGNPQSAAGESGVDHALVSDNQVVSKVPPSAKSSMVQLNASRLVVMGNCVSDPQASEPANGPKVYSISVSAQAATVIGNVTGNGVLDPGDTSVVVANNAVF